MRRLRPPWPDGITSCLPIPPPHHPSGFLYDRWVWEMPLALNLRLFIIAAEILWAPLIGWSTIHLGGNWNKHSLMPVRTNNWQSRKLLSPERHRSTIRFIQLIRALDKRAQWYCTRETGSMSPWLPEKMLVKVSIYLSYGKGSCWGMVFKF